MTKKYRVIFVDIMVDMAIFKQNMAKLGVSDITLDKYIKNTPVVLKRDLSLGDARRYTEAIINAGGLVNIQETGEVPETKSSAEKISISSNEDFVICPNCGFKQKKEDFCVRCDFNLTSSL